jgi:hypothetical protein
MGRLGRNTQRRHLFRRLDLRYERSSVQRFPAYGRLPGSWQFQAGLLEPLGHDGALCTFSIRPNPCPTIRSSTIVWHRRRQQRWWLMKMPRSRSTSIRRTTHICPPTSGIYYGATPKVGTKISDWGHPRYVGDCGGIQRYDPQGLWAVHKPLMYNFIERQTSKIARVDVSR